MASFDEELVAVPIDYTSRDYQGLRESMVRAIPDFLPEWTSRSTSDFGIVMIELFAYLGDVLSFYMDRIANEAYLPTAVLRASVLNIAKQLNYRPTSTQPARTTLQFNLPANSASVTVLAGTQVSTKATPNTAPVIFETDEDVTIAGNDAATPQYVAVVGATQGRTVLAEAIGPSDGRLSQEYILFNTNIIEETVHIFVDEGGDPVRWTFFDSLVDAQADDAGYTTFIDSDGLVHVVFGDNISGRVPNNGAAITADYRIGVGALGNVAAGSLTQLVTVITPKPSVTNPAAAEGGSDIETIQHIRESAPRSFATRRRAVTIDDYAALALNVGGVAKAKAVALVYTNVVIYLAPFGGGTASDSLKAAVVNYLSDKKMINATVTTADPSYRDVNINATINVLPTFDRDLVVLNVQNALNAMLAFENVDLGATIALSTVYHAATIGISGVEYATITLLQQEGGPVGVQDLFFADNEIPTIGTITIIGTGGIVSV